MDINQMRYFIEICHTGSISKAAENLFLTQQGLSGSIRRLENECGCNLFFRKGSTIVLTDAGEKFKTEAEAIVKKVDALLLYFKAASGTRAMVQVICSMNLIVRLPAKLQCAFLNNKSDDGLLINFTEDWTLSCEDTVLEGDAVFGIVYGDCDKSKFEVTVLATLDQIFIVNKYSELAKKDDISIEELSGRPMIIPHKKCRPGVTLRRMFAEAGAELNIVAQCGDRPRQTIDLVAANPSLAARIIADDLTTGDLDSVKPLQLRGQDFSFHICLISKKGRQLTDSEKLFKHFVLDCFKQKQP